MWKYIRKYLLYSDILSSTSSIIYKWIILRYFKINSQRNILIVYLYYVYLWFCTSSDFKANSCSFVVLLKKPICNKTIKTYWKNNSDIIAVCEKLTVFNIIITMHSNIRPTETDTRTTHSCSFCVFAVLWNSVVTFVRL